MPVLSWRCTVHLYRLRRRQNPGLHTLFWTGCAVGIWNYARHHMLLLLWQRKSTVQQVQRYWYVPV